MTGTRDLPTHVKNHLIQTGALTTDGLGRKAQLRQCTSCHAWVIVGLDHHRCALRATCDPTPLDPLGEAIALLAGRNTYELWGRELERRNQFKIAAGISRPVIAEHQCGKAPLPDADILRIFMKPYPADDSDLKVPF